MAQQACPNCSRLHDVAVYVTGQRVLCSCGIKFEVKRTDVGGKTLNLRPSLKGALAATMRPPSQPSLAQGVDVSLSGLGDARAESEAAQVAQLAGDGVSVAAPPVPDAPVNEVASSRVPSVVERTFIAASHIEIPGFDLIELLGKGGMGEVWRAVQRSLGRTVAVKLLPQDLAKDTEFVKRFEKESAALAALSHPHIIQIIDRGNAGPHYYFVMEFVEGHSLREVMTARKLTVPEVLRIVAQILRAIESAHEKEIIHRDLKPENILVDARGHVKVADFGLAGMRGGEERLQLTATAVAMGTINYMAPEQRRDARNVDARADLYSVGVMLYELLTGELPIGRFRMPSEKVEGLDKRLDDITGKLLEADPTLRYESATQVLAALEPMLGSGVSTPLPGPQTVPPNAASGAQVSGASNRSVVERGFRGLRNGLMVIGALAVLGFGARFVFGSSDAPSVTISSGDKEITFGVQPKNGEAAPPKKLPVAAGNTQDEVFTAVSEKDLGKGRAELSFGFAEGDEEINVHSGEWKLKGEKLTVLQAGNVPEEGKALIPRAYVAHRYFSADDFEAEVEVNYRDIRDRFDVGEDVQRFAELSFRITGTQVSVFAIPGVGMRLGWRYFTPDGLEMAGNSARDLEMMVEDEMPAPPDGKPFKMKVALHRKKDAVEVTAYLNGRAFAHKILPGLQGQVGKLALGCRNYECTFDNLVAKGKTAQRPVKKVAEAEGP